MTLNYATASERRPRINDRAAKWMGENPHQPFTLRRSAMTLNYATASERRPREVRGPLSGWGSPPKCEAGRSPEKKEHIA